MNKEDILKKFEISDNHKDKLDFVLGIEKYFKESDQSVHQARNEIKVIKYNDVEYMVKSFKVPHIINKVAYSFFRASKANKSFINAMNIGSFTPEPIAYIEFFDYALLSRSYYISERYKYDFTIKEPLNDESFLEKKIILQSFSKFAFALHEDGILHQDFSPGNILIKKINERYEFKIVDINRMSFKELSPLDRAKSFSKLWAWDKDILIISNAYVRLMKVDPKDFYAMVQTHVDKHKAKKNFFKKLKKKV